MKQKHGLGKILIITLIILIILRIIFYFTDQGKLLSFISGIYQDYGIIILFISGIIEATIILGLYFPGSSIILLGATLAGAKVIGLPAVIIWTTLGIIIALSLDYYLGFTGGAKFFSKYGLEKSILKMRQRIEKSWLIYIWGAVHPNLAAVIAISAGIMKVNFKKFIILMILGQFFWSTFWGLIFYFFGLAFLNKMMLFIGILVALFLAYEISRIFWPKNSD